MSPFDSIARYDTGGRRAVAVVIALVVHVGGGLWLMRPHAAQARIENTPLKLFDVELEKPPPPPPPAPAAPKVHAPQPTQKAAEPPPPAQAGKILDAPEEEVVDLSNSFVSGNSAAYVGGKTAPNGTNTKPVENAKIGGVGKGDAPGPSKAKTASVSGNSDWRCEWPDAANTEQIHEAFVLIRVSVDKSGKPTRISVLEDPGHGFGDKAKACAMGQTFETALDTAGEKIAGVTEPFRVHFQR